MAAYQRTLQAEFGRWKEERRFIEVNIGVDMLVNV